MFRKWLLVIGLPIWLLPAVGDAQDPAHQKKLEGLVKERQADMGQIGRDAKLIGELMKTGEFGSIAVPAERIRLLAEAMKGKYLFGSDMAPSRAAPVVFESFPMFVTFIDRFISVAATTRDAAKQNTEVREAVANLFKECKSCHDVFVVPPAE